MGQTVPCPTCGKSVTLTPTNQLQANEEAQRKKDWDEWFVLNKRLAERRIKSGIPPSEEIAQVIIQNSQLPETVLSEATITKIEKSGETLFQVPEPSNAGSRFARLTAETIRTQAKSTGNTPLHHAARLGKISEIPEHLLTVELFMVRNNHRQKHTPIHAAAQYGQLNKVPRKFLNKMTMTASVKFKGGWRAGTETPLHVAVRYGHADQIPKKFLKPNFLSIAESGVGETVLHELAYVRRLNLVPKIYADSPMWDLKNSYGQTPRDIISTGLDAEQRPKEWRLWKPPDSILPIQDGSLTLLPIFTHESLKAIKVTHWNTIYTVNLLDYICNCPLCIEIHSKVPVRDFGRLCKHIILALREKHLVAQLPPIARCMVGDPRAFAVYPGRFATDPNGNTIYISGKNHDGWLNVYALKRPDGVNYYRFGYNANSKIWWCDDERGMDYWRSPKIDELILDYALDGSSSALKGIGL